MIFESMEKRKRGRKRIARVQWNCADCRVERWRYPRDALSVQRCASCDALRRRVARRSCKHCDQTIETTDPRIFCGRACYVAHHFPYPVGPYVKKGRIRIVRTEDELRATRRAAYDRQRARRLPPLQIIKCRYCRDSFVQSNRKQNSFCTVDCSYRFYEWNARALRRGASDVGERFSPFDVLDRDGYRCRHCLCHTPKYLRGRKDWNAPEVDHFIPCAERGAHSMANSQCLCRRCNTLKGHQVYTCAPMLPLPHVAVDA